MKKFGFTLAEVLITLGIVGIIAALTIPSMTHNVTKRQVGPALAKGINNLENANRKALAEAGAIRLADIDSVYFNVLDLKMNGDLSNNSGYYHFFSNDGISYSGNGALDSSNKYYTVIIDINGENKKPNRSGIDKFLVYVTADGEVVPAGGNDAATLTGGSVSTCPTIIDNTCTSRIIKDGWEMKY